MINKQGNKNKKTLLMLGPLLTAVVTVILLTVLYRIGILHRTLWFDWFLLILPCVYIIYVLLRAKDAKVPDYKEIYRGKGYKGKRLV